MEIEPKYTFVPSMRKNYININEKSTQDLLYKWGLKDSFVIQHFSFNEPFQQYHKYHIADAFFKNPAVVKELITLQGNNWVKQGITAATVDVTQVPCTTLSMSFFDKMKNPKNRIVHNSGSICGRYETEIDDFLVTDNLRGMLLDRDSPEYNLYQDDERAEFIFHIFKMIALGGELCQYEETLDPYLEVTKNIYKDLIRVEKRNDSEELCVSTLVLNVVAKDFENRAYFPCDSLSKQNFGYLLVDGNAREITSFLHQFGYFATE